MPDTTSLVFFLGAVVALLVIPGPVVLYIVTRSVSQGTKAGLVSVLGVQFGAIFHVLAAVLGISALLVASATAYAVLKYAGAAYLVYLGIRTLLRRDSSSQEAACEPMSLRKIFTQGAIVQILNPKSAMFFFAFLPQFVDPSAGSVTNQLLILGAIILTLGIISDGAYALVAGRLGAWLKRRPGFWKFQKYFSGSVYIGLGAITALGGSDE